MKICLIQSVFVCFSPTGKACFYSRASEQLVQFEILLLGQNNGRSPVSGMVLRQALIFIILFKSVLGLINIDVLPYKQDV